MRQWHCTISLQEVSQRKVAIAASLLNFVIFFLFQQEYEAFQSERAGEKSKV